MKLCSCTNFYYLDCLMERYHASKSFAECMGGCSCPCHFTEHGALVHGGKWLENRYTVARAKQERHADPRIEAVMPQEVKDGVGRNSWITSP